MRKNAVTELVNDLVIIIGAVIIGVQFTHTSPPASYVQMERTQRACWDETDTDGTSSRYCGDKDLAPPTARNFGPFEN